MTEIVKPKLEKILDPAAGTGGLTSVLKNLRKICQVN